MKRSHSQFFRGLKFHGEWLHHSCNVVLDVFLIDSLVLLVDERGAIALAIVAADHLLTIDFEDILDGLKTLEARRECPFFIALLFFLEVGEAVHVVIVITLEELLDKALKVLYKNPG